MLIINLFYFKYLFPHYVKECSQENYKLYELSFFNIFAHFIDIIIIIIELWSLSNYKFSDIYLPIYFQVFMVLSVVINYKLRNVWTYNMVNLKKKITYKMLLEFFIYTHLLSYIIFKIKN